MNGSFARMGYRTASNEFEGVNLRAQDVYNTKGMSVEELMANTPENSMARYTTAGSANAYTITPTPAITEYAAGQRWLVQFHAENTSATVNLNINGLGNRRIYQRGTTAPLIRQIQTGAIWMLEDNGTALILVGGAEMATASNADADGTGTEVRNWNAAQVRRAANNEINLRRGAASGVAPLDANSNIPTENLPDFILGQMLYAGTVNASNGAASLTTNGQSKLGAVSASITLTNNNIAITGFGANQGNYYVATTAGTFAGIAFQVGDWLVSHATAWAIVPNTDAVRTVAGRIGDVTLSGDDYSVTTAAGTAANTLPPTTATGLQSWLVTARNALTWLVGRFNASGHAARAVTADELTTARKINGVDFKGNADITIPVPAAATSAPSNMANTAAVGAGTAFARDNHVHSNEVPNQTIQPNQRLADNATNRRAMNHHDVSRFYKSLGSNTGATAPTNLNNETTVGNVVWTAAAVPTTGAPATRLTGTRNFKLEVSLMPNSTIVQTLEIASHATPAGNEIWRRARTNATVWQEWELLNGLDAVFVTNETQMQALNLKTGALVMMQVDNV